MILYLLCYKQTASTGNELKFSVELIESSANMGSQSLFARGAQSLMTKSRLIIFVILLQFSRCGHDIDSRRTRSL